jgi:hypothetical protein
VLVVRHYRLYQSYPTGVNNCCFYCRTGAIISGMVTVTLANRNHNGEGFRSSQRGRSGRSHRWECAYVRHISSKICTTRRVFQVSNLSYVIKKSSCIAMHVKVCARRCANCIQRGQCHGNLKGWGGRGRHRFSNSKYLLSSLLHTARHV